MNIFEQKPCRMTMAIIGIALICCLTAGAGTNDATGIIKVPAAKRDMASNQAGLDQTVNSNADSDSTRVLCPNDVILISVYQEDDLTTKTMIGKNGMVMLPLLGQIKVGGLTVKQATDYIKNLYNQDYLVDPRVNLIVEQFAELHFSVLGQVQHPGSYDFPQNESVNLLEAIAIAGGYTRLGAPSDVDVRRVENGSPKIYHLNAETMSKDSRKAPFKILPDDIISVGERTF